MASRATAWHCVHVPGKGKPVSVHPADATLANLQQTSFHFDSTPVLSFATDKKLAFLQQESGLPRDPKVAKLGKNWCWYWVEAIAICFVQRPVTCILCIPAYLSLFCRQSTLVFVYFCRK